MELRNLTEENVIRLLRDHGASNEGIASVEENGITGEMLVEFCEEDIKDAFTVFKDRFLVRKILREYKLTVQRVNTTEDKSHSSRDSPPDVLPRTHNSRNAKSDVPTRVSSGHREHSTHFTNHDQVSSAGCVTFKNVSAFVQSPSGDVQGHQRTPPSSTQMTESFSVQNNPCFVDYSRCHPSTTEAGRLMNNKRTMVLDNKCTQNSEPGEKYYKREREIVPDEDFGIGINTEDLNYRQPNLKHQSSRTYANDNSDPFHRNDPKADDLKEARTSFEGDSSAVHRPLFLGSVPRQYPHDSQTSDLFLCEVTTEKFSAEELLVKKSLRGKPSEAQRIGQNVIRNAAIAAKLWDTTPWLKDITDDQKDVFFQHVFREAPQLRAYRETVWSRLREGLQNRRKYLLDKEKGKRLPKHAREYLSNERLMDQTEMKEEPDDCFTEGT